MIEKMASPTSPRHGSYSRIGSQDLIRSQQLQANGQLPAVLPLVLYNGSRPWRSATSLQTLIQTVPGGLSRYRPTLTYLLLDESRHPLGGVAPGNLMELRVRKPRVIHRDPAPGFGGCQQP